MMRGGWLENGIASATESCNGVNSVLIELATFSRQLYPMSLQQKIKELSASIQDEVRSYRRHLHQNPELSFHEVETARFVAEKLKGLGLEVQEGLGVREAHTGVCALIKGKNPDKRVVALRADMDALPILEKNDIPYKSVNEGVMHACGHDVHTSSLLGTAMILNQLKDEFEGTIKLIFQPGEECPPGGASLLIEDGILEDPKPDVIIGQHVWPQIPTGMVGIAKGTFLASADMFEITITGKGGHAAMPQFCIDPIVVSAHVILALQNLASRMNDPLNPMVLSVCSIAGGDANNVIPNEVKLGGTLRAMNEEWRAEALEKMQALVQSIAESFGASSEIKIIPGYPSLFNHLELTEQVEASVAKYIGQERVIEMPKAMGSEDFSFYTHHMPGCFYVIGVGNPVKGITANVHEDTFNIDEDALAMAPGLMAWLAIEQLAL